uniref:Odorant receptor n=1 Tax=Reticulitermes speratus TaxID=60591 RepID=A0A0U5A7K1_9NEOP
MLRTRQTRNHKPEEKGDFSNKDELPASGLKIMRVNLIMLNLVGLLPPSGSGPLIRSMYKVFVACVLVMEVLILAGQFIAVVIYWGNLHLIANTMCLMNGCVLSFVSCTYFLRNKTKFLMLIDLLKVKFVAETKSKYIKLVQNAERQIITYLYLSSPIVACSIFSWVIAPFINRSNFSNIKDSNATKREQSVENMIFVMWTPFDIEQSPQFEIITALQVFFVNVGTGIIYAVGMLFLSLMSHSAAQFKVLAAMLDDMQENIHTDVLPNKKRIFLLNKDLPDVPEEEAPVYIRHESSWPENNQQSISHSSELILSKKIGDKNRFDEDEFQKYLVNCIKCHRDIINFVDHVNEVTSIVTFLQILNLPIMLCVTGFHMTQTFNDREQFFKFSSLLAATLYLIFSYSWFGQQLINESEKVATALYSTDWYNRRAGFKVLLPLAIMRASKPVKVKAGVFYDLSFLTFASIINAAYTYLTMLIQLSDS